MEEGLRELFPEEETRRAILVGNVEGLLGRGKG